MRSPSEMTIIEIDITNFCPHKCSNCTRLTAHFKKPFFMDYNTFTKAVDSINGFKGIVGIIGGEPTLHPNFEKMMRYYTKKIPNKEQRYLFTSLGKGYYKHFETIKDTFHCDYQNDHSNNGLHQPILIASDEIMKNKKKMWELIDNCWIQNNWSATITPRGVFFCETAAAIDMLFDGPGGLPIKPNWWKKDINEFKNQIEWACPKCGAAIPLKRRRAYDQKDDISKKNLKLLKKLKSPRVINGNYTIFEDKYNLKKFRKKWNPENSWYLPKGEKRVASTNNSIKPKYLEGICACYKNDRLHYTIYFMKKYFDNLIIVTAKNDIETQNICKINNVKYIISNQKIDNDEKFNFNKAINEGIHKCLKKDWIIVITAGELLPENFKQLWFDFIPNPGKVYYVTKKEPLCKINIIHYKIKNKTLPKQRSEEGDSVRLFNVKAQALRHRPISFYPEDKNVTPAEECKNIWPSWKIEQIYKL